MLILSWFRDHSFTFIFLSHFETPLPQGIKPSVSGIRLAFWSRGLGQHSRTASAHDKQTQLTALSTHVLTLYTVGIRHDEKKNLTHLESNPRPPHPRGDSHTLTPPGRGGTNMCTTWSLVAPYLRQFGQNGPEIQLLCVPPLSLAALAAINAFKL